MQLVRFLCIAWICGTSSASSSAIPSECARLVRENSKAYWLHTIGGLDLGKTKLIEPQTKAFRFEFELAQRSGLKLEEVVGLVRNFEPHPDRVWVEDGSIGIVYDRRTGTYEIDPTINIVPAYKWGMANIVPGALTRDQVIDLRMLSIERLYLERGEIQVRPDRVEFKDETDIAEIAGTIHPEVAKKLQTYGYNVSAPITGRIRVEYSNAKMSPEQRIDGFVASVNQMVSTKETPERIAAFVAQELNLIHAFRDGNGRTSRLLAQILYVKMTGKTIVFPRAFHREMDYSYQDLARMLQ